jgi:hypothetical protein
MARVQFESDNNNNSIGDNLFNILTDDPLSVEYIHEAVEVESTKPRVFPFIMHIFRGGDIEKR